METIFVVKIAKINEPRTIDWNALPDESKEYIIRYGLTQRLNDVHASIEKTDLPAVTAAVDKAVAALQSGEIRVAGERTTNPVRAIALDLAEAAIKMQARAKGKKLGSGLRRAAGMLVDKDQKWMDMAKVQYESIVGMSADVELPEPKAKAA